MKAIEWVQSPLTFTARGPSCQFLHHHGSQKTFGISCIQCVILSTDILEWCQEKSWLFFSVQVIFCYYYLSEFGNIFSVLRWKNSALSPPSCFSFSLIFWFVVILSWTCSNRYCLFPWVLYLPNKHFGIWRFLLYM